MLTQPPFKYQVGAGAGQLVKDEAPYFDWRNFATQTDANRALAAVQTIDPNATMALDNGIEGGYAPSGDPNPDNAGVYLITGTDPVTLDEIDEFAGSIADRETEPEDGIDPSFQSITNFSDGTKSKLGPVKLVHSAADDGCVWVLA